MNDNLAQFATPNHTPQLDAFKQVVQQRRSVRVFTETEIPDSIVDECLRLAMLAPNASNLQPWEFIIIESPDIRVQANKLCMNQNAAKTANKLIAVVARTDTWEHNCKRVIDNYPIQPTPKIVVKYYEKIIPFAYKLGPLNSFSVFRSLLLTVNRMFKGPMANPVQNYSSLVKMAVSDSFLAAQNFILAMRAHGFDTCPMGGFDEPAMKKLLKLNKHQHIAMMIGCGERAEKGIYSAQYRFAFDEHVSRV